MRADAVFSGGGIKGLAFAGALAAAEEAGYTEWVAVGGTSAGAITALALAVGYDAAGLRALFSYDFSKIDDRGFLGLGAIENYLARHSIAAGRGLTKFIESILAGAPDRPGGKPPVSFGELSRTLKVVGSDLVHSRMVVLPDDAGLYLDERGQPYEPARFPLATAVRISAGYPGFFPPVELTDAASGTKGALVDGGVTSSLPVFAFDDPHPTRPTWAFRLFGGKPPERAPNHPISGPLWPVDLLKDIIATAIGALDAEELKAFPGRVIAIPTGAVSTLDFSLSPAERELLYRSGLEAGRAFFAGRPDALNRFGRSPGAG